MQRSGAARMTSGSTEQVYVRGIAASRSALSGLRQRRPGMAAGGALEVALLAHLFHVRSATRAFRLDRLVPGHEVAVGIATAAEEGPSLLGPALDHIAFMARRAGHADLGQQRLGIAAFREPAA